MKLLLLWEGSIVLVFLAASLVDDWLPILALTAAFSGPVIVAWVNAQQARVAKRADWQRQDQLEARMKKAAEDAAEKVAGRVAKVVEVAAETAKTQGKKLDDLQVQGEQIHTLVNSNMTAAMESELSATRALLALLKRLAPDAAEEISTTQKKVTELESQIANREVATKRANQQAKQ